MLTDYNILKHYIGCNITITFIDPRQDKTIVLHGKLICFDIETLSVTIKEDINYSIPFENIESFSLKNFYDLSFLDCQLILTQIFGSCEGWIINEVIKGEQIILKKIYNPGGSIYFQQDPVVLKRGENNSIKVFELYEKKYYKPENYTKVYFKLIEMGYLIS